MTQNPGQPEHFLDDDKSLACVHCGLCLASCPTYLESGNENDSPRGRIYLMRAVRADKLLPKVAREALALVPDSARVVELPMVSSAATGPRKGRVGFISGCVMSVLFGETNAASVWLLNLAGYEVVTPPLQGCCGALYAHGGSLERARACARHNIEVFERHNLAAIVINAAGCGSTLNEYGHLLRGDAQWSERADRFSAKVKDLTEWLVEIKFKTPGLRFQGDEVANSPLGQP